MSKRLAALFQLGTHDRPAAAVEAAESAASPNGERPSWDSSTTCVQIVRDRMASLGWGSGTQFEVPAADKADDLPDRPSDFGVGWWR